MLKLFKNIFLVIFTCFAIWMLFFDANSLLIHRDLNADIDDLEAEKDYYKNEITKDNKAIKELSTEEGIEKLAREKYYMKKENEEIYIIEYEDSVAKKKTND
ncbi:septum formation initiator family protein [Ichthyenterobacterium sp. W332]|uniref:Septum formation initiator family protein n=1 Tax=Microcosmobacter mediterraneus TaxID=3075607 RepID=A0ABU2YJJ5_9FLAO|nr:septum formation initiator family protein [Ichthyenterobacterium sp. W332]MDT0557233.1 septum formation initiator family protein [Ichthyenterobacterium sp. W332]